jgi:hypothetical protein
MGQAFAVVWKHPDRHARNDLNNAASGFVAHDRAPDQTQQNVKHGSTSALLTNKPLRKKPSFIQQHALVTKEEECLVKEYGEDHWRVKGYRFLHKHEVILTLAALMVLDILFMVIDLVISANYPDCPVILQNCECVLNITAMDGSKTTPPTFSPSSEQHNEDNVCRRACVEPPFSSEQTKLAMTIGSLVILSIFVFELAFHISIIGIRHFLLDLFLVIDLIIVLVSIVLEAIVLHLEVTKNLKEEAAIQATTVPLLIVSRGWRVLRIGHGAYKEAHDFYGEHIQTLEFENQELKQRLTQFEQLSPPSSTNESKRKDHDNILTVAGTGSVNFEAGTKDEKREVNNGSTLAAQ